MADEEKEKTGKQEKKEISRKEEHKGRILSESEEIHRHFKTFRLDGDSLIPDIPDNQIPDPPKGEKDKNKK